MHISSLVLMCLIYPETCPRELHWSSWRGSVRMEHSEGGFVPGAVALQHKPAERMLSSPCCRHTVWYLSAHLTFCGGLSQIKCKLILLRLLLR